MSRKISQETFDDVVRENVEDFDLDEKAALQDAINQFTKQGVDLSNIDLSGGIGRQDILDAIKDLDTSRKGSDELILAALARITELCSKDHEYQQRNRMFVLNQGGVNTLHILFDVNRSIDVLVPTMVLLEDLSKNNVEIRDFFEPGGSERLNNVLKKYSVGADVNFTVLGSSFTLARTVCKSESNKNMLMKSGVGITITSMITANLSNYTEWTPILTDCCTLMRGLCVHDDLRKDMSCAYENGRFFLKQPGMVHALMTLSSYFKSAPGLSSASLSAARNLIATEEAVAVMAQHGAIELIRDILSYQDSPVSLVRSAVGLMRNVCADDVRKDRLVGDGSLDLLINVMSQETYAKDAGLMEHAVACLAAISLRSPSNAQRIVNAGTALDILARNMRRYADRSGLQRQGCLTIRNIAARGPELRPVLLDAGFEDILRAAGRMMDVVDEAYGALRDLNCEVHYVKINAEGKAEPVYEQFGAAAKLQFNPIYDEDVKIVERVQEEARAPLPLPPQMPTGPTAAIPSAAPQSACCEGEHDHDHGHGHQHGHHHQHEQQHAEPSQAHDHDHHHAHNNAHVHGENCSH